MTLDALPQIGDVVAGKYRIEKLLGRGGMGAVFAARDELVQRTVAIKLLLPHVNVNASSVQRFLNEARAAARIEGEHVVRVLDLGQLENGSPFIALELLVGWDFARIIATRGVLPQAEAVGYILEALEGLAQAHALGIVHRDLKPGNLFVAQRRDGTKVVKVLDFGISKVTNPLTGMSPNVRTATSSMMGTPNYVAPEQLQSAKHVDARADIWSMGVILYELLCGSLPFQAETLAQLLVAILQQPPTPLRAYQPNVPPALERVVMRCLSQDPAARYQSVLEVAEALAPFAPADARGSVERVRRSVGGGLPPSVMPTVGVAPTLGDAFSPAASGPPQTRGQWTRSETDGVRGKGRGAVLASAAAGALLAIVLTVVAALVLRQKSLGRASAGEAPSASVISAVQAPSAFAPAESEPEEPLQPTTDTSSASAAPTAPTAKAPTAPKPPSGGKTAPIRPPPPPATTTAPAAPTCRIVTEYDSDGQPHFKKVCN
jgi:serine/threonine protein kinase